jgi:hypothetical protein
MITRMDWLRYSLRVAILSPFLIGSLILNPLFWICTGIAVRESVREWSFWRKLRKRSQVTKWGEAKSRLLAGKGILLVEVGFRHCSRRRLAIDYAWCLDCSRDEIDPEHLLSSWHGYEKDSWILLVHELEKIEQWAAERLPLWETSARALKPSLSQLDKLNEEVKQDLVFGISGFCKGTFSKRLKASKVSVAKP